MQKEQRENRSRKRRTRKKQLQSLAIYLSSSDLRITHTDKSPRPTLLIEQNMILIHRHGMYSFINEVQRCVFPIVVIKEKILAYSRTLFLSFG